MKGFIQKLQNLPEEKKKMILLIIIIVVVLILGSFEVIATKNSFSKLKNPFNTLLLPNTPK